MELTSISVTEVFKSILDEANITYDINPSKCEIVKVYADGEMTTTELPQSFIELMENGFLSGKGSEFGQLNQTILLSLYVKLSPSGVINKKREQKIFSQLENVIKNGVLKDNYYFRLDKQNMFGRSRNLISGYSTKLVNILVTIYNN